MLDSEIGPEIIKICDYYLDLYPEDSEIKLAKASTIRFLGNFGQAFLLVDEVLKHNPNDLVAMRLQSDIVAEQDSIAGIKLYDKLCEKSLQVKGSIATNLKWNMCLHLLRTRDFKRGWEFWELGTTKEVGSMGRTLPKYLNGVTRADLLKTIDPQKWTLVCVEQGIGDQILFLSAMNEFIDEFKILDVFPDKTILKNINIMRKKILNNYDEYVKDFEKYTKINKEIDDFEKNKQEEKELTRSEEHTSELQSH